MSKAKDHPKQSTKTVSENVASTYDGTASAVAAGSDSTEESASEPALEKQLEDARAKAAENHDRYLRSVADLENFRRRSVREREELRQFATASLMEDLLPILDNLGLGIASARQQTDSNAIADGVAMVLEQFKGVLNRAGLVEIHPESGGEFDPHKHESMAHQPSDDVPPEFILNVIRTGYSLNGRLLRAASVVLSSGPTESPPDSE
ncbi:MAG: nucleotide exchange factor GrpE [Verrucomicrobia bacterium]|nr:MAG: nucleotide exchange factor GrpE [Verrucomicrobiota bacterium]